MIEALARLRHDLGKYVALQVRGLPPDPSDDDLRDALSADLLRTRSGPDGILDAVQVWDRVRVDLADLGDDPLLVDLRDRMARLAEVIAALRSGSADRDALLVGAAAARDASDLAFALHRAHRGAPRSGG